MKYLIIGDGWIGNLLKAYLGDKATIFQGKINDFNSEIGEQYDVWINTAAKTQIDWVEKNREEAFDVNAIQANYLASMAKECGKKYVFFSSACIFESSDINDIKYEDSEPNPKCFYAETKVMAEKLILQANPDALIIRPRLPLSEIPHPRNTINKLLSYDKINGNQESVTVVEDMITVLIDLIEKDEKGVFHLVNEGTISPAEIAESFGHKFELVSKASQDERLAKEGRAKRVTTYVGSKRIKLLPNIRERMVSLAKKYNEQLYKQTT